ncbi:hypothetical protein NCER_101619 [Vairimorpha ceranae BRL01]|uniref:Uncharacterized protein n=2 Tax=Vairimorpha ceranae TaxID=40302 RepID=C4VAF2_VAIC1|nr:hypothetical protein AAJ76_140004215 [Vairimorpha ceranae]EEQ81800.1 hypothetical protein NCER_101619 [Vairimorpha ceranae BRL01]KKO75674.1 hypothetical protein AAJ76_140004215 [Vairimorpha ceranae]
MKLNQKSKDICTKPENFIDKFFFITSAKACAIMILYNALSKDTIKDIIDMITSDKSSFYYKALVFWLKYNTSRLPIEINNHANNTYLNYKSLVFEKKLSRVEAKRVKIFFNVLAKCEFITVSNMNELFYTFIICKAYAENYHPRSLICNSNLHTMKMFGLAFLGFNQAPLDILKIFCTVFKEYKKFMDAIDLNKPNSVYGIITRETNKMIR